VHEPSSDEPGPLFEEPGPLLVDPGPEFEDSESSHESEPLSDDPGPLFEESDPDPADGPLVADPDPLLFGPGPEFADPGPALDDNADAVVTPEELGSGAGWVDVVNDSAFVLGNRNGRAVRSAGWTGAAGAATGATTD
jgi:hypothetical protein